MEKLFAVYCNGDYERNVDLNQAKEIYRINTGNFLTNEQIFNLQEGHGLNIEDCILIKLD